LTAITDSQLLWTRFCQQSFRAQASGRDTAYAKLVDNAVLRSWQWQCVNWNLGTPSDDDSVHNVVINDAVHWYHGSAMRDPYSSPGPDRVIHVPSYIPWDSLHYTNEDSLIRVAIAHEFYHGIQWGLSQDKWIDSTWDWFTEAQALFLPSVQVQGEEFLGSNRYYPLFANAYLTQKLNTSPTALSYSCDIFWRFMFEKFDSTGIADGVRFVRNCYAETVGSSNSIGRGKAAIDAAMVKSPVPPGWANFSQVLDQFAIACYLNDPSFNRWNPNPPGIYSPPDLTLDSTFRLGPNETDQFKVIDSIPHSFGIDLMEVALNRAAASGMLRRTLDRRALRAIITQPRKSPCL
jgi:hypothetical protein